MYRNAYSWAPATCPSELPRLRPGATRSLSRQDADQGVYRLALTKPSRKTASQENRLKVLVAEPTPDPTLAARSRWERQGFEPVLARNAVETLRHFRDDAPGLVLLDDRLPGFELSGLVRILHATSSGMSIPVILMTHAKDGAAAARDVGADGYIRAPQAKGRLPEAVHEAVTLTRGSRK